jgi:hypothetical protein
MSEKSFAVGSVAAAVICGVFFYPPPPASRAQHTVKAAATRAAPGKRAALDPIDRRERDWWRKKLSQFRTVGSVEP